MKKYCIIRFKKEKPYKVIKYGVTLKEAQEWCSHKDTHGIDWFDGYGLSKNYEYE